MSKPAAHCKRKVHRFAMVLARRLFHTAQDGQCGICRQPMKASFESPKLTFDHVWPKSWAIVPENSIMGFIGNLLLVHSACNEAKADREPTADEIAFLAEVNRKIGFGPHETALWDRPLDEPIPQQIANG